ncbi:MAG: hypothetical protein P1V97_06270 [Planctomycetota bacterium]|nr:hypothetical protein [Planctomycetota bacterium]
MQFLRSEGRYLLPCLLLIALIYSPIIFFGETQIGVDLHTFDLPQYELFASYINEGQLPAWNPYLGQGSPLIGDASIPIFYPMTLLLFVFEPLTVLCLFPIIHGLIQSLGCYLLARQLRLSPSAASFFALVFVGGGVGVSQSMTPMYLGGVTWLPWALYFLSRFVRSEGHRALLTMAGACCFSLIFLIGAIEYCIIVGVLALLFGGVVEKRWKASVVALSLMAVISMCVCALVLIPMIYQLPVTGRGSGLPLESAGRWSFSPVQLLGLISTAPLSKGVLPKSWLSMGGERPWFHSVFMGVLPFTLMIFGLRRFFEDQRLRYCALVVVLCFPLALGLYTPIYRFLFQYFPGVSSFRYPGKLFMPVFFALSLISAIGWEHRGESSLWKKGLNVLSCALLIVIASTKLLMTDYPTLLWLYPFVTCVVLVGTLSYCPKKHQASILLFIVACDLGFSASLTLPFAPRDLFDKPPPITGFLASRERQGPVRIDQLSGVMKLRVGETERSTPLNQDFIVRSSLSVNTGMPFKIGGVQVFSPLKSRRWSQLRQRLLADGQSGVFYSRFFGVNYVIYTDADRGNAVKAVNPIIQVGPWKIGECLVKAPWAAIYTRVSGSEGLKSSLDILSAGSFDARDLTVIEGAQNMTGSGIVGQVQVIQHLYDRVELTYDSPKAGYLVLREAYHPDWVAELDGEVVKVHPADAIFRAVWVPPGIHTVVYKYQCPGWKLGSWMTVVSLLLLSLTTAVVSWTSIRGRN